MLRPRIIPVLLLKGRGLYKPVQFKNPKYIGDPINTVRIFNEKEVDEICVLDITATIDGKAPNFPLIREIASEAFMPMSYGGGVRSVDQAREIFNSGVEKIVFNTLLHEDQSVLKDIIRYAGSSSVVASIDVRKKFMRGYEVYVRSGTQNINKKPVQFAQELEALGVGEILLHSIDREGMMEGFDSELIGQVCAAVNVPVIACGGAGSLEHFPQALESDASAVAAGSFFVYQGKHRAVLISYPSPADIENIIQKVEKK